MKNKEANPNKELIKNFLASEKIQDRMGSIGELNENEIKSEIGRQEEILRLIMSIYLENNFEKKKSPLDYKFGMNYNLSKDEFLSRINEDYGSHLNILKELDVNISQYPKTLGSLIN